MEESQRRAMKETIDLYMTEMGKVLPETNDESLIQFHNDAKTRALDYFRQRVASLPEEDQPLTSVTNSIEDAFLDILDRNWQKCELICREALSSLRFTLSEPLPTVQSKTEASQSQWWTRIKNLRIKYRLAVGEWLNYQMPHVWLEYLSERQEEDFKVLMGDILMEQEKLEELEDDKTTLPNLDDDEGGFEYERLPTDVDPAPENTGRAYSDFCLETTDKQMRLQMTWGRVFVFWKYWLECRKDTVDALKNLLDIVEDVEQMENASSVPDLLSNFNNTMSSEAADVVYRKIMQNPHHRNLPLVFSRTISKDFLSYKCLIQKLREFFDMILKPEFVCAFDMNPARIFEKISTFQVDMTIRSDVEQTGFQACAQLLENEQDESHAIARLFRNKAKPLFHVRTFLNEILQKTQAGDHLSFTIGRFLMEIIEEERSWSAMLTVSIDAMLTVASNVMDSLPQLRRDIIQWSPQRDETIAQLNPVIEKLHETTKNVAITQTVSSSVGIVGGAIAIGGLIMAPFTMGASLIPTAIAGGVVSGISAATAIGASVTEVIIDKEQMKKAAACLEQDKVLFEGVANQIKYLNINSTLLIRYIPQDELESFISVITDPKSKVITSVSSSPQANPRIAINIARLVSVGGRTLMMPVSRLVLAGTIAASRVAVLALAHGIAAIGIALDIANLVVNGVKLGKGAKSQSAERLEDVIERLEEEKKIIDNCLNDISLDV